MRLNRLANRERGLSTHALRQLYMACVVSVADYGTQVFWKGQVHMADTLQRLQNLALRVILGAFRTSPVAPMEVEAALPPPAVRLNASLRQYALRARRLPPHHPVRLAMEAPPPTLTSSDSEDSSDQLPPGPPTQLSRISSSVQHVLSAPEEQITNHSFMPWQRDLPYSVTVSPLNKEEQARAHSQTLLSTLGSSFLAIYSDASSHPSGQGIGVAIAVFDQLQAGSEVCSQQKNIGDSMLVYNGELEGITMAFEYAASLPSPHHTIQVYADNQAALWRLMTPSDQPGQAWQLRCIKAARQLQARGSSISAHWVPGHTGVHGNERVDGLAKRAALKQPSSCLTSLAMTACRVKKIKSLEWMDSLRSHRAKAVQKNSGTYSARFHLKTSKTLPLPLSTPRKLSSAFFQLKLGHGYLKAYLFRLGKADSPFCSCGARQTVEHLLLSCKWLKEERKVLTQDLNSKPPTLPLLLHTSLGIKATLAFISRTQVGTRKWHLGELEAE